MQSKERNTNSNCHKILFFPLTMCTNWSVLPTADGGEDTGVTAESISNYETEHCQSPWNHLWIQISMLSDSMLTCKGKCSISESTRVSFPYDLLPSGKESLFTHISQDRVVLWKSVLFLQGSPIFIRHCTFQRLHSKIHHLGRVEAKDCIKNRRQE